MKKSFVLLTILMSLVFTSCNRKDIYSGDPNNTGGPNEPGTPAGPTEPTDPSDPSDSSTDPVLTSISVVHTVDSYLLGDEVDKSTLTVTAHYDDESSVTLTAEQYQVNFNNSTLGVSVPVTITYLTQSFTYYVSVDTVYDEDDDAYINIQEGHVININVGDSTYLTATYSPSDFWDRVVEYAWESSDSSILEVKANTGKITGKMTGNVTVTLWAKLSGSSVIYSDSATIVVRPEGTEAHFRYQKVSNLDDLRDGDVIVFACPEQNIGANNNRLDGALGFDEITFSSDKSYITSLGDDIGEYVLTADTIETDYGDETVFNMQCYQNSKYLSAKNNKNVTYVTSKGNLLWGFETYNNRHYVYSTTAGIEGQLMFNITAEKFTIYDSNELTNVMILPTIYRYTEY